VKGPGCFFIGKCSPLPDISGDSEATSCSAQTLILKVCCYCAVMSHFSSSLPPALLSSLVASRVYPCGGVQRDCTLYYPPSLPSVLLPAPLDSKPHPCCVPVLSRREFARWKVRNTAIERRDLLHNPLPLMPEFQRSIRLLGRRPTTQQFIDTIIKKYGTHILISATLGGRWQPELFSYVGVSGRVVEALDRTCKPWSRCVEAGWLHGAGLQLLQGKPVSLSAGVKIPRVRRDFANEFRAVRASSASVICVHLCSSDNGVCVPVCVKINMLHLAGEPVCHSCAPHLRLRMECVDPSLFFQNETKCRR